MKKIIMSLMVLSGIATQTTSAMFTSSATAYPRYDSPSPERDDSPRLADRTPPADRTKICTILNTARNIVKVIREAQDKGLRTDLENAVKIFPKLTKMEKEMLIMEVMSIIPNETEQFDSSSEEEITAFVMKQLNSENLKKIEEKIAKRIEDNGGKCTSSSDSFLKRITNSKLKRAGVLSAAAALAALTAYGVSYYNTPVEDTNVQPGETPKSRGARALTNMTSKLKNPFVLVALGAATVGGAYWVSRA